MDVRLGSNVGQIGPKWDKSWIFFSDQIQYILAHRAKMYWIWSEKIPGFFPFGANLTHFGPKSGHPGSDCCQRDSPNSVHPCIDFTLDYPSHPRMPHWLEWRGIGLIWHFSDKSPSQHVLVLVHWSSTVPDENLSYLVVIWPTLCPNLTYLVLSCPFCITK